MAKFVESPETRNLIIRNALYLFLHEGFHHVGMEQIAAKTFVNRQTIYYYFPGKEPLRFAVYQAIMNKNLNHAFRYSQKSIHRYSIALYILWMESQRSELLRHFILDMVNDIPIYNEKYDYCLAYRKYYQQLFRKGHISKNQEATRLASAYGHTHTLFNAVFRSITPDTDIRREFLYGLSACAYCYDIPAEEWDPILQELDVLTTHIPEEKVDEILDFLTAEV